MMDGLKTAKTRSTAALNAFRKVVQDLEEANKVFGKVKEESKAAIARAQSRHDEAHSAEAANTTVIANVKKILGE
jgi:hypothetical protein